MNAKPVTPQLHGIIDYTFSALLLALPRLLRLNPRAQQTYTATGVVFLAMNAISDTPVAVKPLISFEDHQKADAAFLGGLAALTFSPFVGQGKRTRTFHVAFLAVALTHYVLTNYKAGSRNDLLPKKATAGTGTRLQTTAGNNPAE